MKKIVFLLSFIFLLQSCFSYKTINSKSEIKENKKIKIVKIDNHIIKGKIVSKNEKEITIISSNKRQPLTIPISEVKNLKIKKFSYLKTLSLGVSFIIIKAATVFGRN